MGSIVPDKFGEQDGNNHTWVRPTIKPLPQTIRLTTVDQYVPKMWLNRVLFFRNSEQFTNREVYDHLRDGLSRLIAEHPIFSGKLCRQQDNQKYAAVRIEDDPCVLFNFKDCTNSSLGASDPAQLFSYAQYEASGFPLQGLQSAYPDFIKVPVTEGSCMFAAQANFVHGGLLLALTMSHLLVDGGVFMELIQRWSCYTAQAARGEVHSINVVQRSLMAVEQLSTSHGTDKAVDPNMWTVGPADKPGSTLYLPNLTELASTRMLSSAVQAPNALKKGSSSRIWHISVERQKALKSLASAWSINDAVFALFWNRNVVHRHHRQNGVTKCLGRSPINIRQRMEPPIPNNHIGNAVLVVCTECSIDEVEGNNDPVAAIRTIAQKFRETIRNFDNEYVNTFIHNADALPDDMALVSPSRSILEPNILLNDHSKLDVYKYDWGSGIGAAQRQRDAYEDVPIRGFALCNIFPKLPDGTIEVVSLFDDEFNESLLKDEFFGQFFELSCAGWPSS